MVALRPLVEDCRAEPLTVDRVDPLRAAEWNETVRELGGSAFHASSWARVLASAYGYRPLYYTVSDASGVRAALPLMEVNSWLTGRRGISLPFTDECEALADDPDAFRSLVDGALRLGRLRHWRYVEIRGGRHLLHTATPSLRYFGHRLTLARPEAELFAGLESSCRRAVRRAQQRGVEVEFSTERAALRVFYGLLRKTRKRHGLPPQPWSFFVRLHDEILLQQQGLVGIARIDGRAIAAAVYLNSGDTMIYKYGASDDAYQQYRANNLVMWEAIRRFNRDGCVCLDFGRTSVDNGGLRAFKLGWGTEERAIEYVKYDLRANRFVADEEGTHGWHNRIFRHLPSSLSRVIGALLYRHIA